MTLYTVEDPPFLENLHGIADIYDVHGESFEPIPYVSVKQAKAALTLLKTFTEQSSDVNDYAYSA